MTHDDLVQVAARWLQGTGRCSVVLADFRCMVAMELPDAIGWPMNWNWSVVIECKVSRSDFFADRRKPHRRPDCSFAMGCERYYLTPPGLVKLEELPEGWGLLEAHPGRVRRLKKSEKFTEGKRSLFRETQLLLSAVNRLKRYPENAKEILVGDAADLRGLAARENG